MITYTKVLVLLLSVTCCCLGDRLNHKRWEWPVEDDNVAVRGGPNANNHHAINFGNPRTNAHPPHHHPPSNVPRESERIEAVFPGDPRPTPSPAPVRLAGRPTSKPRCATNLECDAPCEHDEEYNSTIRSRIDKLINLNGGVNTILKDPVLKTLLKEVVVPEEDGPAPRGGIIESPVCAGTEEIIFPERAKTENDDWAFVLNQGSVTQGIKYEKCISTGKCNLGAAGTEIDTVCRQKYIYKKMLVMDGQGSKILPEQVLMPSCCICYIQKPFHGFGRIAPRKDGCL